jgi:hypothetical protein
MAFDGAAYRQTSVDEAMKIFGRLLGVVFRHTSSSLRTVLSIFASALLQR